MNKWGYVYILASGRHGTLYTGVTSNLEVRIHQHRDETFPGFTSSYDVKRLVWFEGYPDIRPAIDREKRIKKWRRDWRIALIEAGNPEWRDLALDLGLSPLPEKAKRPFRVAVSD